MPRPMTKSLAAAIDRLSPRDRRVLKRLAVETASNAPDSWLSRLLWGIRSELLADELTEMEVLGQLEREHREEVDRIAADIAPIPQPPTDGEEWWPMGTDTL